MSLIRYKVEYESVPPKQREKLLEEINTYSFNGALIDTDFCSCEFFMDQNIDVHIINLPPGSHLIRM